MPKEISVTKHQDGSSTIRYDDGSVELARPDGSGRWTGSDNSVSEWDAQGEQTSWDRNTNLASDRLERFPIKTQPACQLKWSHSTVFLPYETTASCHRVNPDAIPADFDFHNTPEKLVARQTMLQGKWPGRGCEYCKFVEQSGGLSDRLQHLEYPNLGAPPELADDPTATRVTPRWVEVYFSNICNLGCLYCSPKFSSVIETEKIKFEIGYKKDTMAQELKLTDQFFKWLDENIHNLWNLIILGGEPFIQPQSDRLIDMLETLRCPDLTVTFFSNLSVNHARLRSRFERLQQLKDQGRIKNVHVVASIDCWGEQAQYVRSGLNIELFEQNFLYLLEQTNCGLNINMTGSSLSVFTMPALIEKINEWNRVRRVYVSLMLVNGAQSFLGSEDGGFLSLSSFGNKALEWGFRQSVEQLETYNDIELEKFKQHMQGLMQTIDSYEPDVAAQKELHQYLSTIDQRRGKNYKTLFPTIVEEFKQNGVYE